MNRLVVKSRVGPDGVLRVTLPVGADNADQDVQVTVEPLTPGKPMTQEEWKAWVESMAGSITDPTAATTRGRSRRNSRGASNRGTAQSRRPGRHAQATRRPPVRAQPSPTAAAPM